MCIPIEVEFQIHGSHHLHGDGMAIWLTKQRATPGPVFGSTDRFEGLGIFIDTYKNNRPGTVFPYVMAMVGDGETSYNKGTDGKENEFMGCSARGIRGANIPTKARLTYFQDKQLKLELQYVAVDQWELCFETSDPPTLPSVTYLGFSAETGELHNNHDIISVTTKNLYDTKSRTGSSIPGSKGGKGRPDANMPGRTNKSGGSWTWFFVKIFLFILACGGGYVGYTAWRANNKRSHRF
ncbi:hypothetical protein DH86_00002374 [Scytalidium sp. 3C]|nr:hypothetical protein DH86_00002374 [Scytalidium sp. 3C]